MGVTANQRPLIPVPFTAVKLTDVFWAQRQAVNRERTLPIEYRHCQETGRIDAFKLAWEPGQEPEPHIFWDSDVAKWIEAGCYSLSTHPDTQLRARLEEVIALIIAAQGPDGYLNVHFTVVEPEKRWANLRDQHELYCAGHLIEAAVAHFQTTGERHFLDCLCRYADYIATVFGVAPGQKHGYCGHEEIELALVKLYHATGEARYLRLSQYFVDERGQQPCYFDEEARARGEKPEAYWARTYEYCQAHAPVREQTQITGHAVRAMYLYSAMADLAGELHDDGLRTACERIWDDLCGTKMYVTGGIGPSRHNEGFTVPYDLPNDTAYAETCAAIGLVFWGHRLLQWDCDARYADVMERALYNGVISGVALDGETFFYENPLASRGMHHRQPWFGCACCPTNLVRLLASLGQYFYSQRDDELAVHLYAAGAMQTTLTDGAPLTVTQQTRYPWDGEVTLTLGLDAPTALTLRLRIPGWCRQYTLCSNGAPLAHSVERGYACVTRTWQPGESITLQLAMPIERIAAHPHVVADQGRVALQRGPLVYCLEDADHSVPVHLLALDEDAALSTRFVPDLLDGVVVIEGEATAPDVTAWAGQLFRIQQADNTTRVPLRAIPYYAWDNRMAGEMAVWLPKG
ncbi:MAG TPA: beta-L-arabinofuranosidase domain-containing protein [Armatimonadota bacterium]|jgi:hypothetical protein